MNAKKTALLAVVLALAVLYLLKVALPSRERVESEKLALRGLNPLSVERLSVTKRSPEDGSTESFELINPNPSSDAQASKQAEGTQGESGIIFKEWRIESLPGAKLDTVNVSGLMNQLRELKADEPIKESGADGNLSIYGLDKPSLEVVVQGKALGRTEILFGKKNDYLGQRYAKVSGRPGIYLVDEAHFTPLNKGRADIRDKTPVEFTDADVRQFTLESAVGKVSGVQTASGEWQITRPVEKPGSNLDIANMLRSVKDLRATEFLDGKQENLKDFGLDAPKATLSLSFREGIEPRELVIRVGVAGESGYFSYTGAPSVFKTAKESATSFELSPDRLRDRRLVRLSTGDIAKLVVEGPDVAKVEIVATDKDWSVNGKPSDPIFVEHVLETLADLEASQFADSVDESVMKDARLTLTITTKGASPETKTVVVSKQSAGADGKSPYVRVGKGDIALIPEETYKRLVLREETLIAMGTPQAPKFTFTPPVSK